VNGPRRNDSGPELLLAKREPAQCCSPDLSRLRSRLLVSISRVVYAASSGVLGFRLKVCALLIVCRPFAQRTLGVSPRISRRRTRQLPKLCEPLAGEQVRSGEARWPRQASHRASLSLKGETAMSNSPSFSFLYLRPRRSRRWQRLRRATPSSAPPRSRSAIASSRLEAASRSAKSSPSSTAPVARPYASNLPVYEFPVGSLADVQQRLKSILHEKTDATHRCDSTIQL
jgi:hypothetical protein